MVHKLTVLTLVPSFVPVLCGFCGMSSRCVAQAADVLGRLRLCLRHPAVAFQVQGLQCLLQCRG